MRLNKGYPASTIAEVTGAVIFGQAPTEPIEHLLIDSRKLLFPSATLFFAIRTHRSDGHHYIEDLYKRGVRSFVVTALPASASFSDATFFQVNDVVLALQLLATYHRQQFHFPVVGITGSNGKTIVKEWLNHILQH